MPKLATNQTLHMEGLATHYVSMNTSIPVPTVLDIAQDHIGTLFLMTRMTSFFIKYSETQKCWSTSRINRVDSFLNLMQSAAV